MSLQLNVTPGASSTHLDYSVALPDASVLGCDAVRVDLGGEDVRCLF